MTSPWRWSDPPSARVDGPVPGIADDPPPGWTELVDGRGVYLRRTPATGAGTDGTLPRPVDTWYVHGLAGSSTNWTALAGLLAPRATGYLVDLPGHGRSDPPPRCRHSMGADAALLARLIRRRAAGPVHLVANSLGGVVAVRLAAGAPELIASLTLISPAVPDLRLTRNRGADPLLGLLLLPGTTGPALRRLNAIGPLERARGMAPLCFGNPDLVAAADLAVAAEELSWRAGVPWAHTATIGALRALLRSYLRPTASFWSQARAIAVAGVPTLVVWGTHDRLVDVSLARRTATALRGALLVLPGVGHTAQLEAPLATARAVAGLWDSTGAPRRRFAPAVATSSS